MMTPAETGARGQAGRAVGRRGLVAGAAALVAGLLAKNAADAPKVAASSGGGDQGFLTLGSNPWYVGGQPGVANTAAVSASPTVLQASPNYGNFVGQNGADSVVFKVDATTAITGSINGISGYGRGAGSIGVYGASGNYGVFGNGPTGVFGAGGTYGVSGNGVYGVYGNGGPYGVYGTGGTYGIAGTGGTYGVAGSGDTYGVAGVASTYGVSGAALGNGGIGVYGTITGNGSYAVAGHASQNVGVYGLSDGGTYPYGVLGQNNAPGGFALFGSASVAGSVAFGGTAYGTAIAGQFIGPVNVYGQITLLQQTAGPTTNAFIVGPGVTKNAAVAMPDGSHALMHCVEAPEPWFEDFGEGTITGGKAEIKLDAEFLHTVDTTTMHVFPVAHDPYHNLHVAGKSATGFTVGVNPSAVGIAAGKKASDLNGTFTHRVVAKRRDVKGDRLMRVTLPKPIEAKLPPIPKLPDPSPLPAMPKMPPAPKP